ncbi:MAG: hypothetical protein JW852_08060 [Spirochaetales bacterium]|nr:hypothetical protein [Spirochaetales bacterium]
MYRKTIKFFISVIALTVLCSFVYAGDGDVVIDLPSARTAAVGGLHVTVTDDLSSLFANPAGFISADPQISLAEVTLGMQGPIFDIAGLVIQGLQPDQEFSELLASEAVLDLVSTLYAAADILGPVSFGYLGKGLGFGFFNTTDVVFKSDSPLTMTAIAGEQITLAGGYAFRIPLTKDSTHVLDLGVLLKGSLRGEVELKRTLLELPGLFSSIGLDTVTESPFKLISGIGIDAGIRYGLGDIFAVGIVGKDLYTPTMTRSYATTNDFLENAADPTVSYGAVPIDLTAGVLFSPRLGVLSRYVSDLRLMVDYVDILDFLTHPATARNPILHASLGVELRILEILMIRGGFSQGLFAAGLGLDLTIFGINIAMYGTELSSEPGLRPVYNAQVGIDFRL